MRQWATKIYYGGDYNPDQWEESVVEEDLRLFRKAGINLVTLPVFSWAKLEPDEGVYAFEWLDDLMNKFAAHGISVCLATPTTAQPAWLSARYPEVLPVDIAGRKRTHGMRVFFCYNSLKYRERAAAIAEAMAERYHDHPALVVWHVSNEYGTYCYCENCQAKFRRWLRERYGSIKNLNDRWHTSFWGRTVYSFEEIMLPTELNDDHRFNPGVQLDYQRFVTDSTVECFLNEYRVLKKYCPDIPVQTNMSGYIKKLDQFKLTKHMDILGWDNYPAPSDRPAMIAFRHDLMRGLYGQKPFVLMEQTPSVTNWQPYNRLKRPGEMRLLSWQAVAHGADAIQFFQIRRSIGACEKYHGAVIDHAGRADTRVFREVTQLGEELENIGGLFLDGKTPAKAAILFDWDNWWAVEYSAGPSIRMKYIDTIQDYYQAAFALNVAVDIIRVEDALESYQVVIAPLLYMVKHGYEQKLRDYVAKGGTFVTSYFSGMVDEHDLVDFGGYPGRLRELMGIWVEENDALPEGEQNAFSYCGKRYPADILCDLVHLEGAEAYGVYEEDFYAGMPALTVNQYGKGKACYVATHSNEEFYQTFLDRRFSQNGIQPVHQTPVGVEAAVREHAGETYLFLLNHTAEEKTVVLEDHYEDLLQGQMYRRLDELVLEKKGVRLLRRIHA